MVTNAEARPSETHLSKRRHEKVVIVGEKAGPPESSPLGPCGWPEDTTPRGSNSFLCVQRRMLLLTRKDRQALIVRQEVWAT